MNNYHSKMKILLVLALSIYYVQCGIILEVRNPNRVHNGHCYAEMGNLGEMAEKETKVLPPGNCYMAVCQEDRDVLYRGCAPFQAPAHCKIIPADDTKTFPDCCEQSKCGPIPTATLYLNGTVVKDDPNEEE